MAHKKAGGSTRNGRDSESKRLGVKKYGGEAVLAGTKVDGKVVFQIKGPRKRKFVNIEPAA